MVWMLMACCTPVVTVLSRHSCVSSCLWVNILSYDDRHLTHWGRVTHICVNKLTSIGSGNGLSPGRRQAIIWTNSGILLIRTLGTIFSEILIEIYMFPFTKMHLKMSSGKWQPFCLGLNVLTSFYVMNICCLASTFLKAFVWFWME